MIYYRVALHSARSSTWQWKSSILTSLNALFGLLRIYAPIPKDNIRVFFASSTEYMNEMLTRENNGLASNSITAEQLLEDKKINTLEMKRLESELGVPQEKQMVPTSVSTALKEKRMNTTGQPFNEGSTSSLEMKRLELELRSVGDHDIPYTFSLPASMPQVLAWTRLLAKVQRGEVEP